MINRKVFVFYLILFFASLSLIPQILNAETLDNWNLRNPLPTCNLHYGKTFGNGVSLAIRGANSIRQNLFK